MPGHLVAARKQRRREQHLQPGIALELFLQRFGEFVVGIKPRDFVFVLVGHQLEQAFCNGFGQLLRAGRSLGLCRTNALDIGEIAF